MQAVSLLASLKKFTSFLCDVPIVLCLWLQDIGVLADIPEKGVRQLEMAGFGGSQGPHGRWRVWRLVTCMTRGGSEVPPSAVFCAVSGVPTEDFRVLGVASMRPCSLGWRGFVGRAGFFLGGAGLPREPGVRIRTMEGPWGASWHDLRTPGLVLGSLWWMDMDQALLPPPLPQKCLS